MLIYMQVKNFKLCLHYNGVIKIVKYQYLIGSSVSIGNVCEHKLYLWLAVC